MATSNSKIKVSSYLKVPFSVVPSNETGKLQGKALVRIEAPAAAESRTPIDLVLVLDVSSGGDGLLTGDSTASVAPTTTMTTTEKPSLMLDQLVHKALTFITKHLEGGLNHCSVVSSKRIRTLGFSRWTAQDIKISGGGGGGLSMPAEEVHQIDIVGHMGSRSDLEHAMKVLDERPDKTRQGFIILLSDGLAGKRSEPSSSSSDPQPQGSHVLSKCIYPVHTFGLGKAHDPKILRSIAKETNGTYSSITEDLESKTMEALAVCLSGLKSVVAVNTRVSMIKPDVVEVELEPEAAAPPPAAAVINKGKVKVNKESAQPAAAAVTRIAVTGLKEKIKDDCRVAKEESNSRNVINLGVICAGEVEFIVDIDISSFTVPRAGCWTVDLYIVTVGYKDIQLQANEKSTCTRKAVNWASNKVTNEELNKFTPCPMVLQQMFRLKVLEFMREFEKELDAIAMDEKSNIPRLIIVSMMTEENNCILGQGEWERRRHLILQGLAAQKLEEMWKEFKETDKYHSRELAAEGHSIDLDLLGRFDNDIGAMVSCLRRGSGLGCIYSWVLSHEMQQSCFTGLPTPPAFLTPAMRKTVNEVQAEQSTKNYYSSSAAAGNDRPTPPPAGEGEGYMRELLLKMCNSLEGIESKLEQSNAHFRNSVAIVMPLTTNPPPAGGNGAPRGRTT